ncbi:hypothetical protein ACFL6O_04825 [candidate division KSB1 bacterium]
MSSNTDRESKSRSSMKVLLKKYFPFVFALIIFGYIFNALFENIDQLRDFEFDFDFSLLAAGMLVLSLHYIIQGIISFLFAKKLKIKISFLKCWAFWMYSQLGKYIPGKIWIAASRAYLYKKEDLASVKKISFQFILEQAFSTISVAIICVSSLFFINFKVFEEYYIWFILMITAFLVFFHPSIFFRLLNYALSIAKRDRIEGFTFKYHEVFLILMLEIMSWIPVGISFYLIINSIASIAPANIIYIIAIVSFSFIVGFFAIFLPAGLGVRDVILWRALIEYLIESVSIIVTLVFRLAITICELLLVLFTKILIERWLLRERIDFRKNELKE